jgi:4-hydroxy-tetrahydrodipicolinate reductase
MSARNLAIVGHGKMGRAVEQLAVEAGWTISAVLDENWDSKNARHALNNAAVAVEFSEPAAAPTNIRAVVGAGCPIVVGTTGWHNQLDELAAFVRGASGTMMWSPNFSIGAQILISLARTAGSLLKSSGEGVFDAHLIETHHSAKKDKPSGTAIAIGAAAESTLGRSIPITSVRTGHVPGTHELIFDGLFEQIRVVHQARDRRVFAAGALVAADWLRTRKSGVYTMQDLLATPQEAK